MIARELLVKLGFDIQVDKLNKFNDMVDNTKNKMASIKQGVIGNVVSPEMASKAAELKAYQEELKGLSKDERADILALNSKEKKPKTEGYQFASLTKEEAMTEEELKKSNKVKKEAAKEASKEVLKTKKEELKEQTKLEKEAAKEATKTKEDELKKQTNLQKAKQKNLKESMASIASIGRKFAIAGAAITAGFGLSLRSTLKDVANFKEGKSSSVFDKSQISTVNAFNKTLNTTKSTVASLRNSFVIDMLPAIKETLEVFNAWVQKNKELIKSKLKTLIEGLSTAFKILSSVIGRVIGILDMIVEKTVGWKFIITTLVTLAFGAWLAGVASSVMAVASAFKVLTVAMMTNPLVRTIAILAVVFTWLTDEMVAFRNGGKTTADLLKEWGGGWAVFGGEIERVYTNISNLIDAFKELDAIKISKTLAKMINPFSMLTDNEVVKTGFTKGVNKLFNSPKNDLGKLGQGNVKHLEMPKYTANDLKESSSIVNNHNKTNSNVTQKYSFNMNITVPVGTSQEQAKHIGMLMKAEIEKYDAFKIEKTINAIGAH